jgi:hypothetical protein
MPTSSGRGGRGRSEAGVGVISPSDPEVSYLLSLPMFPRFTSPLDDRSEAVPETPDSDSLSGQVTPNWSS